MLASVSVVTRIRALGVAAGAIGLLACLFGLAVVRASDLTGTARFSRAVPSWVRSPARVWRCSRHP